MTTIRIKTSDDIHHTCMMYGLKLAYRRHPQLARNLNATPPPFRRNPELPRSIMEEYLRIRHPFLLYKWNGDKMMGVNDADEIATINID